MKYVSFIVLVLIINQSIYSQSVKSDTITRKATIISKITKNSVEFSSETPVLNQIAGAPKAFYTYFWEFGDGNYSKKEKPTHTYKNKGTYKTRLAVTNNYDDGKPPTTRPKEVAVLDGEFDASKNEDHQLLTSYNGFRLQTNRDPVPDEEMQFVVSYANEKEYPTSGKLYVFFNEKKYKNKNFELTDVRLHNNEQEVLNEIIASNSNYISKSELIQTTGLSTLLDETQLALDTLHKNLPETLKKAKDYYHDFKLFNFDNLQPKEERNMFFSFKTTPEMIKDTSAVITIRSIYVPERGNDGHKIRTKEMEIVTSHDPNKMAVYDTRLNYRLVRFKRLKYKVRFQNDGEGPARLIKLNVDVPKMLDKSSLVVLDMYPKCPICPEEEVRYSCLDTIISKDQISFQFKNIYLPGTAQKGVHDKDSTQGFVKYSMKFGKNFHKQKSKSQTSIIFDKNEPIVTNSSTSRFSPGISIGVKAGYNNFPDVDKSKGYFLGATISPYKSYKKYLQAEIMIASHDYESVLNKVSQTGPIATTSGIKFDDALLEQFSNSSFSKLNIDVVPVSFRYNLNGAIGVGFGAQCSFDLSTKEEGTANSTYFSYNNGRIGDPIEELSKNEKIDTSKSFSDIKYGLFGDITIGASRIGPSVGARYIYNFNSPTTQFHFYAIWKI